jgi:hypothetical protein
MPLLDYLLATYGSQQQGGGSSHHAADSQLGAALVGGADGEAGGVGSAHSFRRAFVQEVDRVRLFIKSSLEQLWLALLHQCATLRGLGEELLQVGGVARRRASVFFPVQEAAAAAGCCKRSSMRTHGPLAASALAAVHQTLSLSQCMRGTLLEPSSACRPMPLGCSSARP